MKISNRLQHVKASPMRKLIPFADEAKAKGIEIYHLNIGQPDIKTPDSYFDAIEHSNLEVIKYEKSIGNIELINSIKDFFQRDNIILDTKDIIITNGGSEAVDFAIKALCDPGDYILAPEPFYANYKSFCAKNNVNIKGIPTTGKNGFRLPSKEVILDLIDENVKAILFSNPGNPTGVVYTKDEVKMLIEIATEKNIVLISDEVYRKMVFDDADSLSTLMFEEAYKHTVVIESVSKRYSSCGVRIGAIISKNKLFMQQVLKLAQSRLCVATIEQLGAARLYRSSEEYIASIKDEYQSRRDVIYEELSKIDGVVCEKPAGAFYVVAGLPVKNAEEFVKFLLTDFDLDGKTVMLSPAKDFYSDPTKGDNEVRIAYVLEANELKKAMNVLAKGLEAFLSR